jgi:glutamate---cysteine ligase / carboxylate-amine ligase
VHKIMEMGSGADRQIRVFEETGDLKKVVDFIIEETEVGVAEAAAPVSEQKAG